MLCSASSKEETIDVDVAQTHDTVTLTLSPSSSDESVLVEFKNGKIETTSKRVIITDNADGSRSKLTKTVCETLKVTTLALMLVDVF
jgi:hypothetical protein